MAEKKFIPVKVTDREWAEKLLDGEVFMRPLYEFGAWNLKKEDKQLNNSFRGDLCEGMSGIFGEVEERPIYDSFDEKRRYNGMMHEMRGFYTWKKKLRGSEETIII